MNRQLGKVLRKRFAEELRERLPQFRCVKGHANSGTFNTYEWSVSADLHVYVVLQINTRFDSFTIELSWSKHQGYPAHLNLMFPRDIPLSRIPRDQPKDGEFKFRLSNLYADKDVWWELIPRPTIEEILEQQRILIEEGTMHEDSIEAGLERVDPCVKDAVDKLIEHGIPFVLSAAAANG
jgi:hypothetical protein